MHALGRVVAGAPLGWWIAFHLCTGAVLVIDITRSRIAHPSTLLQAMRWAAVWIALAVAVFLLLLLRAGSGLATQFAAGYLLEQTLSVDNLFLFLIIFRTFAISPAQQHRVLAWGVLGAVVMRAALLAGGLALIARFHFVEYIFGAVVLLSGVYFYFQDHDRPTLPRWLQWLLARLPVTQECGERDFFVRKQGRLFATALLLALVAVECTDLVFALDSIPAVLAVSRDYFVVYTSNVLAVLSLRALFPAVVETVRRFRFMPYGIATVLVFVGAKMLLQQVLPVSPAMSLAVIAAVLAATILLSRLFPPRSQTVQQ